MDTPPVATPLFRGPSNLCHVGLTPRKVVGVLRTVLAQHFADPERIEAATLRSQPWHADLSAGIAIESVSRWKPSLVERHPAVLIRRGAFVPQRIGIGDRGIGGGDLQGETHHEKLVQGSCTLLCAAGEPEEAEVVAEEVWTYLRAFAQVIRASYGLKRLEVGEMGPVSILRESTENFAVPIEVGVVYGDGWTIYEHSPKLKRIEMAITPG